MLSKSTRTLKEYLEKANEDAVGDATVHMTVAESVADAMAAIRLSGVDCIISSWVVDSSSRMSTLDLLHELHKDHSSLEGKQAPVLVLGPRREDLSAAHREAIFRNGVRCFTNLYYELLSEMAKVLEDIPAKLPPPDSPRRKNRQIVADL